MTKSLSSAAAAVAVLIGLHAQPALADHHKKDAKAPEHHVQKWQSVNRAVAVLHPTQGNKTHGEVHFHQDGKKVRITAKVAGLEPNSSHAIHVHEFGDCSAPDGTSAGGHYNPEGHDHALPDQGERHAGDLGNLKANGRGVATYELVVDNITIAGLENPIIGRSVIVHAKKDDGGQPTGNAGARIACGVIGVAKQNIAKE